MLKPRLIEIVVRNGLLKLVIGAPHVSTDGIN